MAIISPFAVLRPRHKAEKPKNWQFHIRKGEHPRIRLYVVSDFEYDSHDSAKSAAERYCIARGIDPFRVKCYTVNRLSKKDIKAIAA